MIWRTFDPDRISMATAQSADDLQGVPPVVWLEDKANIALTNTYGDVALFEPRQKGVYCGHYFFLTRGRDAVEAGEDFLEYAFSDESPIHTIIGMTPLDKKGALWMSRRLGFTSYGDEDIDGRLHRIFVMTKKDYSHE